MRIDVIYTSHSRKNDDKRSSNFSVCRLICTSLSVMEYMYSLRRLIYNTESFKDRNCFEDGLNFVKDFSVFRY